MQSSAFSAPLADEHRDGLRRQASEVRLARGSRPNGRRHKRDTARWWRLATRSTQA